MNRLAKSTLAAALVLTLAGCGKTASASEKDQSITRMSSDIIATMDAGKMTDAVSSQTLTDTMAGLYRYDHKKITPDMAKSRATVSGDHKTYTFHLRHGMKWSDGHEVTAYDFQYAWRRVVDPTTKSDYAYIMSGIKNADAIMAGKKNKDTLGAKATGKYTFVVTLDRVIPYFEKMICLQTFDPVEQRVVDKYGKKFATTSTHLTYNGPYLLKNWGGTDDTWTEVKNPKYWNAKNVHIKKITYQVVKDNSTAMNLFKSGKIDDVDLTGQYAQSAKQQKGYHIVKQSFQDYLSLNRKRVPAFKNTKIRQALSMAINRSEFIKKVLGDGSTPATSAVASSMYYNDKTGQDFATATLKGGYGQYTKFDLKRARQLFQAGMKELGKKQLSFSILSQDTPAAKSEDEYLQAAFEKLSTSSAKVTVSIKSVPQKSWLSMGSANQYDMFVSEWGADYPDAQSFLALYTTAKADFSGAWNNKTFDRLMAASSGKDAAKPAARWNDMLKANRLLTKEEGIIPLYQHGSVHLTSTKIKGMTYEPNSMYQYIGAKVE